MSTEANELTKDEVFDVLSNSRRRRFLYLLYKRGGEADLRDLARDIAAAENDVPPEEVEDQVFKRLYISLYQTHVPKLEDHGLVTYDKDEKHVEMTDRIDEVVRKLDLADSEEQRWPLYYLLLALLGGLLVAAYWVGAVPVNANTPAIVAALISLALLALTLVHYYVTAIARTDRSRLEALVR